MNQLPSTIDIVKRHVAEQDFLGTGVCYRERDPKLEIDTLIIHSCYIDEKMINPQLKDDSIAQNAPCEESIRVLLAEVDRLSAYDAKTIQEKAYDKKIDELINKARHDIIVCHPHATLETFSFEAILEVFRLHGVSAHYFIERDASVFELVPDSLLAFHAGLSKMPRAEDGRESVNQFSIGVEIFASPEHPILREQYEALAVLTKSLRERHPLKNFYGHSDIAPGRKTDPENFDWKLFAELAELQDSDHYPGNE